MSISKRTIHVMLTIVVIIGLVLSGISIGYFDHTQYRRMEHHHYLTTKSYEYAELPLKSL